MVRYLLHAGMPVYLLVETTSRGRIYWVAAMPGKRIPPNELTVHRVKSAPFLVRNRQWLRGGRYN
jgi:hypothetical protein